MEENHTKSERAKREEEILKFWKENGIFGKTLKKESPKGEFVFYEGPPTANGRPGIHHLEGRAFKDAIPRYKTMRGYHVRRKAGWDTHGLPVELEVEKQLGLKSKKEIEEYGVAKFNEECKKSVWKYVDEWRDFTDRIGFWVDMDNPYVTYHNDYIEAVWSVIEHVDKKNLLYKDYKVVPWCPRCGTALSSHELAQGYADVKDLSVYAKLKIVGQENAYFLAWTTTPWTLPGNIALAVGKDIDYVEAKVGEEILVLAKERLSIIEEPYEVIAEHKGSEMAGMSYEPLYPFLKDNYQGEGLEKAYKVYTADFVNTEDGTGIVHTAVMYGQDDFVLGTEVGLPKHHLVDESGHFKPEAGFLAGKFVKDEETAVDIIKDLAHRGLLFKKEKYEHSYPHCWRCSTPLIYYARDSWYIRMSSLRSELINENKKINWEPDYIKEGRFGEWLREVKDWAISRERYWGTPLPVWESKSGEKMVVGSLDTLKKYSKPANNKYFVMRHGQAESNEAGILDCGEDSTVCLVEEGRKKVKESAETLKGKGITKIFSSQLLRARQTAEIVKETLGIDVEIVTDPRLNETGLGEYNGKPREVYTSKYRGKNLSFTTGPEGGETPNDIRKKMGDFLYGLEKKYKEENILIVSHGDPLWMLDTVAFSYNNEEAVAIAGKRYPITGEVRELEFVPLPHNADYELDLHKPYIDEVVLVKDGVEYLRTKEVMDVWFDSGSMPFAQDANARQNPTDFSDVSYPADFISEGIDQTRGWFYTMHAIGTFMDRGAAFKNVICLGLIMDKDGKKMSKSVGNVVSPWEMMDKYGVDTLRLWMYSVNQPGESKNFDERTVEEVGKKIFNLLDNVYNFYETYTPDKNVYAGRPDAENLMDKWMLARTDKLASSVTHSLEAYKLLEPVREMRDFVDDLSTWYLRRSRQRLREGDRKAQETLLFALKTFSKVLAPFAPFAAEDLYQRLKNDKEPESVHLCGWPAQERSVFSLLTFFGPRSGQIFKDMDKARSLVTLALDERQKAGIRVRQPLKELRVRGQEFGEGYLEIIREEINVKEVIRDESLESEVWLDTELTPELEEEGRLRELIRSIQDKRKEEGLTPGDLMHYSVPEEHKELFEKYSADIKKATNIEF